jgi:hypothetical protein
MFSCISQQEIMAQNISDKRGDLVVMILSWSLLLGIRGLSASRGWEAGAGVCAPVREHGENSRERETKFPIR